MFDDILPKDENSDITWNKKCKDCNHGSFILSNYPGKVLCQSKRTHVDHNFYCNKWIKKELIGK
jgi:hypothetical protein